ncbi:TPA: hypothetical protein L4U67_001972 [Pseudomonas aeruginosa]|nr:hypothetical protein [Pseudomonas aeruginosa]
MSSTQHQLIEQCATRLRGIVEALDNIHDNTPHRWSTDLDEVHSSAESLLALINDQAPAQDAQGLALRTIAEYPCPEQDNMTAANMRQVAADAITGALAFGAQASQPPAADHWLRPFYDIGRAEGQRTQELAMLVRMLASSLKRHAPESNLVARATNYLMAKGLTGSPLRNPLVQAEDAPVIGCLCGMPMTEGHHSPDGCCNLEEFAPQAQAQQAEGAQEREALPHWPPCNPACDPELNGFRDRKCNCAQARTALAHAPTSSASPSCKWTESSGIWETGCGQTWSFIEDGPAENGALFCHHCGGRLVLIKSDDQEDDGEPCPECMEHGCNGECAGHSAMGD